MPAGMSASCRTSAGRRSARARSPAIGRSVSTAGRELVLAAGARAEPAGPDLHAVRGAGRVRQARRSAAARRRADRAAGHWGGGRSTSKSSSSHGGPLGEHKGINAPGVALPPSAVTDKDVDDLRFGLELGVDFVALSFVQTAEDVARAREIIDRRRAPTPIIAKIERPAALENLEAILSAGPGRDGGARRSRPGDAARAGAARAEANHPLRPRAGPAGDCRDPGVRVDARRAATDARRGQRCRERRRGRRGRDHAGRGNRRGGVSRPGRADARRGHPRRREDAAGRQICRRPSIRRAPATARRWRGGGHAGHDRSGRCDRRGNREGRTAQLLSACRPLAPILAATPEPSGRRLAGAVVGRPAVRRRRARLRSPGC